MVRKRPKTGPGVGFYCKANECVRSGTGARYRGYKKCKGCADAVKSGKNFSWSVRKDYGQTANIKIYKNRNKLLFEMIGYLRFNSVDIPKLLEDLLKMKVKFDWDKYPTNLYITSDENYKEMKESWKRFKENKGKEGMNKYIKR